MSHEATMAMARARLNGAKREEANQESKPLSGVAPKRSSWNSVFCCFGRTARQAEQSQSSEKQTQAVGKDTKVAYSDVAYLKHV